MAQNTNGSKEDTTKYTESLWVVVDREADEIVRTKVFTRKGEKKSRGGLLAIYTSRQAARDARNAGIVRKEGTRICEFCEFMGE